MAKENQPAEAVSQKEDEPGMSEDEIDLNLDETFPASDPPSWTLGTDHREEPHEDDKEEEPRNDPRNSTKG